MTEGEREAIEALTTSVNAWRVEMAEKLVPRDEIDRRETKLWEGVSGARKFGLKTSLGIGALNVAGFAGVILAVLAR